MKKLFQILMLFSASFVFSQINEFKFSEVVQVSDGRTAQNLYAQSKMWLTEAFKDSREVIKLDDPVHHIVMGEGTMIYRTKIFAGSSARTGYIRFKVKIESRDGRYKYDFYDFMHEGASMKIGLITLDEEPLYKDFTFSPKKHRINVHNELRNVATDNIKILTESLKQFMDKSAMEDNW